MSITFLIVSALLVSIVSSQGSGMGESMMEETMMSGLRVKMNPPAVDLMRDVAVAIATNWVMDAPLEDMMGTHEIGSVNVNYSLTSSVISSVQIDPSETSITVIEPNQFRIDVNNYVAMVAGSWEASLVAGQLTIGTTMGSYSGYVNMSNHVVFQSDVVNGTVVMSSDGCNFEAPDGAIMLMKEEGEMVNSFETVTMEGSGLTHIRNTIAASGCNTFAPSLIGQMNTLFAAVPMSAEVINDTYIDLTITKDPMVMGSDILMGFNGKVYPEGNPDIMFPYQINENVTFSPSTSMAQIIMSDYVMKTFLDTLYLSGGLAFEFDPGAINLPGNLQLGSLITFIIPGFAPYSSLPLTFQAVPKSELDFQAFDGYVEISGQFSVAFTAELANGTKFSPVTFGLTFTANGTISASGNVIGAMVDGIDLSMTVDDNQVGEFNVALVLSTVNGLLPSLIKPAINALLGQGFPVPNFIGLQFSNLAIMIKQDALEISGDVSNVLDLTR